MAASKMAMVKKDGKMIPAFAADGKGKMKKGGAKKPKMMDGGTKMGKGGTKAAIYKKGGTKKK
jgi:hypothetical protein